MASLVNSTKHSTYVRRCDTHTSQNLLVKNEEAILLNILYEANITLIPKAGENNTHTKMKTAGQYL